MKDEKKKDEAWAAFHRLLAEAGVADPGSAAAAPVGVDELVDRFVGWCKANRSPATAAHHQWFLESFKRSLMVDMPAADVRPFHVQRWIDAHGEWSSTTANRAATCVKRMYSWADEQGYVEGDPVRRLRKAPMRRREQTLSAEQWATAITAAGSHPQLQDFLVAMRATGCRPQELRRLEARHLDRRRGRWRFPASESKGNVARVIVPPAEVWRRSVDLADAHGDGPRGAVYRNRHGNPWTRAGLHSVLYRLAARTGIPGLCAYTMRHTYATEALAAGMDAVTVGVLMGHRDPSMVGRIYQHLADRPAYLDQEAERAAATAGGYAPAGKAGRRKKGGAAGVARSAKPAARRPRRPKPSRRGKTAA